jgi:hypothetical protein
MSRLALNGARHALALGSLVAMLVVVGCHRRASALDDPAAQPPPPSEERNVPWKAQAEILRRGAMVERVRGFQDPADPLAAIADAMQPPPDDSHKWLFTLVVTKNCRWCEQMRSDFASHPKLKAWVDTADYRKSWAHWQVVQIEDASQAWRFEFFKPTQFPTLIVQPPVNGSWGDPHTIVFAHQGYLPPDTLDGKIRAAIQAYAAKVYPRHLAWEAQRPSQDVSFFDGGTQQAPAGYNPPAPAPSPLPSLPSLPSVPTTIPPTMPPSPAPSATPELTIPLQFPSISTILLFLTAASNVWMLYRELARKMGIQLLLTDEQMKQVLAVLSKLTTIPTPPTNPS